VASSAILAVNFFAAVQQLISAMKKKVLPKVLSSFPFSLVYSFFNM